MATMQKAPNTALGGEDLAALEADLGRLNEVAPGLGDRAVRYVACGTDTSVPMEIKSLGTAATATFEAYYGSRKARRDAYEKRKDLRGRTVVRAQAWPPAILHL